MAGVACNCAPRGLRNRFNMTRLISIRRCWTLRPAAAVLLVALAACDSGQAPLVPSPPLAPIFTPPTTPSIPSYHASGIVTDRAGSPIAGVSIEIDFRTGADGSHVTTKTTADGRYQLDFQPLGPLREDVAAVLIVSAEGYQTHWQYLEWGVVDAVKDVRLPSMQTIDAGQSLTVSIEPDYSFCSDGDIWHIPELVCVQFQVLAGSSGTLTVSARALAEGAPVFTVFAATGWYREYTLGPGTVSLEGVRAGGIYTLFVGLPPASAPQRYAVSTSLQAQTPATQR